MNREQTSQRQTPPIPNYEQTSGVIILDATSGLPEFGTQAVPTTLEFFPGGSLEAQSILRTKGQDVMRLRKEFDVAAVAFGKYREAMSSQVRRIDRIGGDITEQLLLSRSSRTISTAYLKTHEELSGKNFSSADILSFFRHVLKINFRHFAFDMTKVKRKQGEFTLFQEEPKVYRFDKSIKDMGDAPFWFKGTLHDWRNYLIDHANFARFLSDDPNKLRRVLNLSIKERDLLNLSDDLQLLGATFIQGAPEWLKSDKKGDELKKEVEAELEYDTESEDPLRDRWQTLDKEFEYLRSSHDKKHSSMVAFYRQRELDTLPAILSLSDLALYSYLLEGVYELPLSPDQIRKMTSVQIDRSEVPGDKQVDKAIKSFFNTDRLAFSSPVVALWLERRLIDAGFCITAQEAIRVDQIDRVADILVPHNNLSETAEPELLRDDKLLRYDVIPLITMLPEQVRRELHSLFMLHRNDKDGRRLKVEEVIWLLADHISQYSEGREAPREKATDIALHHMKKFGEKWVRSNWKWMVQNLQKIHVGREGLPDSDLGEEGIEAFHSFGTEEGSEPIVEIQQETERIVRGALAGWQVLYTTKPRMHAKDLVEISGETREERERNLAHFFGTANISCTMEPDTVLDQLGQVIEMPGEDKHVRMRQVFDGVTYYKERIGRVRILYTMDENSKVITFFVHQKKADDYRL